LSNIPPKDDSCRDFVASSRITAHAKWTKVFCFFSSEKKVLLSRLQHRVANNMQVAAALLTQTRRAMTDEAGRDLVPRAEMTPWPICSAT
jgi:two-component sensor histidine kinase